MKKNKLPFKDHCSVKRKKNIPTTKFSDHLEIYKHSCIKNISKKKYIQTTIIDYLVNKRYKK